MNPASTSFVLGFHGCDRTLAEQIFSGAQGIRPSANDYDWLGDGMYFWEHNARRAYEFACEVRDHPHHPAHRIKEPTVVGAIIDLGLCLNLLDSRYIELVRQAHHALVKLTREAGAPLPVNFGGADLLVRKLDCAVIRLLHASREASKAEPFDSVRAVFHEGKPLYENAGFAEKNHIQLCVRNPNCIKGYFRPLDDTGKPMAF